MARRRDTLVLVSDLPAISLFSGVGGLDYGAERAGYDIRAAVEFEKDSAASLRLNQFPDNPDAVFERSIVGLPTDEILERAGLHAPGPARP